MPLNSLGVGLQQGPAIEECGGRGDRSHPPALRQRKKIGHFFSPSLTLL